MSVQLEIVQICPDRLGSGATVWTVQTSGSRDDVEVVGEHGLTMVGPVSLGDHPDASVRGVKKVEVPLGGGDETERGGDLGLGERGAILGVAGGRVHEDGCDPARDLPDDPIPGCVEGAVAGHGEISSRAEARGRIRDGAVGGDLAERIP
ncbi:hypothetical protein D3C86_1299920 [compost metagenome]